MEEERYGGRGAAAERGCVGDKKLGVIDGVECRG